MTARWCFFLDGTAKRVEMPVGHDGREHIHYPHLASPPRWDEEDVDTPLPATTLRRRIFQVPGEDRARILYFEHPHPPPE